MKYHVGDLVVLMYRQTFMIIATIDDATFYAVIDGKMYYFPWKIEWLTGEVVSSFCDAV